MRRSALILAMLMGGLARAGSLQAGIYNFDPPPRYHSDYLETNTPRPLDMVMIYLGELRQIHDDSQNPQNPPKEDSLRIAYKQQVAKLEVREKEGVLDTVDCVNLSGCLIRLGGNEHLEHAERVLEKSLRDLPPMVSYRCLLLLHRAAVYQALAERKENEPKREDYQRVALRLQEEALDNWPSLMPGWSRQELAWFRRAELYTKWLMELRHKELNRPAGREMPPPDELFPLDERNPNKRVHFVGDSGKYEAGGIAMKQMDRLPADADQIALQLLIWRPYDTRLVWLYGELLNARGSVEWAFYLLEYVKKMRWQNAELDRHHQILKKAVAPFELLFRDKTLFGENLRLQASLLWTFAPRGGLLATPLGTALGELGGWSASTYAGSGGKGSVPPQRVADSRSESKSSRAATSPPLPDWRHLTVSFVAGMVVAVLGLLQWQQWRRRTAIGYRPEKIADSR